MARFNLPVNLATTYPSASDDPTVRTHQQHHDAIHRVVNLFDRTSTAATGAVPIGDGGALVTRPLTASDIAAVAEVVNVKDFGALGDGRTDDTQSLRAAAAALTPGSCLYLPGGTYLVSSPVKITVPCYVQGGGGGYTLQSARADVGVVLVSPRSKTGIFTVSSDAVHFRRLFFTTWGGPSAASTNQPTAIEFTSGDCCSVSECVFTGWHRWLWFQNCASWIVRDNHFELATGYGIQIQNRKAPDNGDQVLTGNMFASNAPWNAAALVRQESGGGLKVIGNKFLCPGEPGAVRGFELAVADGVHTSILLVLGNSFENFSRSSIRITHAGPQNSGSFAKVNVTGNQFTGGRSAGPVIDICGRGSAYSLGDFLISSNTFDGDGARPSSFVSVANAARVAVTSNVFFNGPTAVAVGVGATTTSVPASNSYFSVAKRVAGSAVDAS